METTLVIGGGVAGLGAARELARRGERVLLLEARERLGGRVWTGATARGPVELGAEFVHGLDPALWGLLERAGLAAREAPERHAALRLDGSFESADVFGEMERVLARARRRGPHESRNESPDESPDETIAQLLARTRVPPRRARLARDLVENFHAAPPERASVRALVESGEGAERIEGERAFRVVGGYGQVVEWLAHDAARRGAEIVLGALVREVRWREGAVEVGALVRGEPVRLRGRAAIVTLPLAVLAAGDVRFEPALPGKERVARELGAGQVARLVLRFRRRFWPRGIGFVHTFDEWLPVWWENELDPLALTAWSGGPNGERASRAAPADVLERACALLARVFELAPGAVRAELASVHAHDWRRDPLARMAYTYVPVGAADAPRRLAEPVARTLFFAGEATASDGQLGTVHGALRSGVRAAREASRTHAANGGGDVLVPHAGTRTRR